MGNLKKYGLLWVEDGKLTAYSNKEIATYISNISNEKRCFITNQDKGIYISYPTSDAEVLGCVKQSSSIEFDIDNSFINLK